jgi:gamma-glutamylcyclotransferase
MSPVTTARLYFAYGSNLSLTQMASRCPTSVYHSLGVLRGYRWIIGERGYANIVTDAVTTLSSSSSNENQIQGEEQHGVYGMLYTVQASDELRLDRAEGVPYAYIKRELDVELLSTEGACETGGEVVRALVYVDESRLGEGVCREEYTVRINRGIRDAVGKGMKGWYVERVIRPFVPGGRVPWDGEEAGDPFHPTNIED